MPENTQSRRQQGAPRGVRENNEGGQDAKAQGTRGRKTRKAGRNEGEKGKGNKKKQKNPTTTTNGATPARRRPNKQEAHQERPKEQVRRTKTRPGGRPAQPGEAGHAHAHTRGTRLWRPPTRKGRCRRPQETAPVHQPSPPSHYGRYEKPDASVTGSTHAKPPQRTQPKTEAGGTRQGQPHRGAANGYDAERAQRPCLGRGQRQAQ